MDGLNQLWVADLTYIRLRRQHVYLAVVLDAYSRRVVGWALSTSLHSDDIGGVKVGLQNSQDVKDAFELMVYRAQRYLPEARIWGCLVQEMAPAGGLEVLVGMNRDPQFGPLVTFGFGGIYVETLRDVTFRVAPFSRQEAEEMLTQIRAHALLDGVRGQLPVDK